MNNNNYKKVMSNISQDLKDIAVGTLLGDVCIHDVLQDHE